MRAKFDVLERLCQEIIGTRAKPIELRVKLMQAREK
jgi:hypothetical protein